MDCYAATPGEDAHSLPAKDQGLLDSLVQSSLAEVWSAPSDPIGEAGNPHELAFRSRALVSEPEAAQDFAGNDDGGKELDRLVEQILEQPAGDETSSNGCVKPVDVAAESAEGVASVSTSPSPEAGDVRSDV